MNKNKLRYIQSSIIIELVKQKLKDFVGYNYLKEDGKCHNCRSCCGLSVNIPMSEFKRIEKYWTQELENNFLNQMMTYKTLNITFEAFCPFSTKEHGCSIYENRPSVCRAYLCDVDKIDIVKYAEYVMNASQEETKYIYEIFKNKELVDFLHQVRIYTSQKLDELHREVKR